jgi:HNH endonuclease
MRARRIHPKMWTNTAFLELSCGARLALLALGTFSDYSEHFAWDEELIAKHAGGGWVLEHIHELERAHLVIRQGAYGEIMFAYGHPRRLVSRWEWLRSLVFRRDDYTCQYCGSRDLPLHCDHAIPVSRGGSDELENLVTACKPCNLSKHNKTPEEWLR